jgi:hypothetical protein
MSSQDNSVGTAAVYVLDDPVQFLAWQDFSSCLQHPDQLWDTQPPSVVTEGDFFFLG